MQFFSLDNLCYLCIKRTDMKAQDFLKKHKAKRVEDLTHDQLITFAQECMDTLTAGSISFLLSNEDELNESVLRELDRAIVKAYNEGKSVHVQYVVGESFDGDHMDDAPGLSIELL